MSDFLEKIIGNINIFDIFFLIILIYFTVQCFLKGFSLSLISFYEMGSINNNNNYFSTKISADS